MASRFDWYEKVRITSNNPATRLVDGQVGAILGKAEDSDGPMSYGVFVYSQGRVWSCSEDELISTGEFDKRESFHNGDSLRVSSRGEVLEFRRASKAD